MISSTAKFLFLLCHFVSPEGIAHTCVSMASKPGLLNIGLFSTWAERADMGIETREMPVAMGASA